MMQATIYAVKWVIDGKAYVDLVSAENKMEAMRIIREEKPDCYVDWVKEEI
ncbi:hypothetical protein [Bacillus wiedmannii]|uniref:hypothetical protein n=1 Tax=Bacillus wiedmannii TaxID=1890302 RepID=UPI0015D4DDB8|nr:hypothetical protein [Bacillus wiedmannii]